MQVIQLPPGNMSYIIQIIQIVQIIQIIQIIQITQIIQIRNTSALKKLDHELYWE